MSDYATETVREVSEWPGAAVTFTTTKRHNVAVLSYRDRQRRVVFAATPSDNVRGLQNHIGVVRQELRGLGASRLKQQPSPHKDRERNKPVRPLILDHHPASTPSDPFAVLTKLKGIVMASVAQISPAAKPQAGTVQWFNECVERSKAVVFSETVTITPGLAAELLRHNDGNRGIKSKVNQYADDMRANRWTFNGEPLIVSNTGELNDGQHRMLALIDANVCLPFVIVFGVSRESRETVDQGAARGASDYLGMGGMENATSSATISRLVLAYENSDGHSIDTKPITNSMVVQRARSDGDIPKAAHFGVTVGRKAHVYAPSTIIGFCYYLFAEIDEADARDYLTQISTGENLKAGSAAIAVRERLVTLGKSRQAKVAVIIRGWNFYRRGMKVRTSSLPATMPLPALV